MAWLLRQGEVLASVELAGSSRFWPRLVQGDDGVVAVLVRPSRTAHSFGARVALDVAYLDEELTVLYMTRLGPYRIASPRRRVAAVLHAEAGAFDRWRLQRGDMLEVRIEP